MPGQPQPQLTIAPLPAGWNGTAAQLLELIQANAEIVIPDGMLIGHIGSATPPNNSGPWLKDGTAWWIWDIASLQYIPMEAYVAVGRIELFAYSAIDLSKYVPCDGSAIPRAAPYNILYARIGTTFGNGDGSTSFNVPDLKGRTIIGSGTGDGLSARTLGDKVGEEKHVMTVAESTLIIANTNTAGGAAGSVTAQAAQGHNNMQPSLAIMPAIRYA